MATSLTYILDKRHTKSDGRYPLVLKLTHNRRTVTIPSGFYLKHSDWDVQQEKIKNSCKEYQNITRINNGLIKKKSEVNDVISELFEEGVLNDATALDIKKTVIGKKHTNPGAITVFKFLDDEIQYLIDSKRIGTARSYRDLKNKLSKVSDANLSFRNVNYRYLLDLERHHLSNGAGLGSLGVYMRTLRSLYNKAIKSGVVDAKYYPFKDYKIRRSKPQRKAQSKEEILKLINTSLEDPYLEFARKLYLASFYMQGMNWMDMCLLKRKQIKGNYDRIEYIRHKTNKPFNIKIFEPLRDIIISFEVQGKMKSNDYVFPLLDGTESEQYISIQIENKRVKLNKRLKRIAEKLEIDSFSIYTARHTWATLAKYGGTPTAVIQEALGHETEQVTQTYLKSFGNDLVDQYNEKLFESLK
jgi:integrase